MIHVAVRGTRPVTTALLLVLIGVALLAVSAALPAAAAAGSVLPIPDTLWKPAEGAVPATGNSVYLQSDPNDFIGLGRTYLYTQADAAFTLLANGGHLYLEVVGNEHWYSSFTTGMTSLQVGYYPVVSRDAPPYLEWYGDGRGGSGGLGWIAVDRAEYTDGALTVIDLRFEQSGGPGTPALHGAIHWRADDTTQPPGPVLPVPGTLWQPAPGSTPATGNYVYLKSDAGDPVGSGGTYLYTQADAVITVTQNAGRLTLEVKGDEVWSGEFKAMTSLTSLQAGYYPGLHRYPFHYNPLKGGLNVGGPGYGTNQLAGWFAVDQVTYSEGVLTSVDLRFEQQADGAGPSLHGAIHWRNDDATRPPGPILPVPDTLWKPAAGSTPAAGNFVYLDSDAGDYIGAGKKYVYTQADAVLTVSQSDGVLTVRVNGDQWWRGDFMAMNSLSRIQAGYYPGVKRYPAQNPARGGMYWYGESRGSNTPSGWFAVDDITYADGVLASVDLRFEQHSEGATPALHGAIHWRADDTTQPPGPALPIPDALWRPPAGLAPDADTYVFLDSDAGDYIGQGGKYLYTQPEDPITVTENGGHLWVHVDGDEYWYGDFKAMAGLDQLQPGYYPNLTRYPFNNPIRGGLSWYGEGRGSNSLTGWFAVDDVRYTDGQLTSIDLRFEQHDGGGSAGLHGAIHWKKFLPAGVAGTVTSAEHAGLKGIDVTAYRRDVHGQWQYVDDTSTDGTGAYRLDGLYGGHYRVEFDDYMGGYLSQWYSGAASMESATDLSVERGAMTAGVDATLRRAGHITGIVRDMRGVGLQDVFVCAYRANGSGGWRYVSGADTTTEGAYDLAGLDTGAYRIEFSDWSGEYVGEWYDDQTGVTSARDVQVTAGQTTAAIDAMLDDASHITGTVRESGGAALHGISVTAYRPDGSGGWIYANDVETQAGGAYDIGGLAAGTYRVEFDDWSESYATQCFDGQADLTSATDIVVGVHSTVGGIDAILRAPGHVTGKVTNPVGYGLEDISVVAYRRDGHGTWQYDKTAWTAPNGTYDLSLRYPGPYRLQFVDYSGVYGVLWYGNKATLAEATDVTAASGWTRPGIDVTLGYAGHIKGIVSSAGRPGLADIDVSAYQPDGYGGWIYVNDVLTDNSGAYDLAGLSTGVYHLQFDDFSSRGYATQYYDNQASLAAGDDVAVTAGATTMNVNAILGIRGGDTTAPTTVVTGADGAWCKAALVTLAASDNPGGSGVQRVEYRIHGSKTWWIYTGPIVVTTEGSTKYDYRSVDAAQNAEAIGSFTVNVDSTAPGTSGTGASDGDWLARATELVLAGADSAGGSGVTSLTITLDGVTKTVAGQTTTVPLPTRPNGTHTVTFSATDAAGNQSLDQLIMVHVDTAGPVTAAKAAAGRVRKAITLRCRVGDNLSPQATGISVVVKNRRHKVVKTFRVGAKATGTWFSLKWRPAAKGTYSYSVSARDLAGNKQTKARSASIIVR